MPLSKDISRCVGKRIEEDASVTVCIKRNACERHLSLSEMPREELRRVPVSMYLCTDASYAMQIEIGPASTHAVLPGAGGLTGGLT